MSKHYLENIRNIRPASSHAGYMLNHKLVMNLKGPNFIEPAFANICFEKDAKVEGVIHELTDRDLDRIVASEGKTYELVEAPVTFRNTTVIAKTLRCKESAIKELPVSKRYMKILIAAAKENNLSLNYVEFLKSKKWVYYPVLSEIFAIRVYFWVKIRAR
tara:strand:+ start:320 stop:799 length:480 start_codon:yes stop_codon:yes gene_type:complete